ncbi:MAG: hypothetical protein A2289_01580 [Deltaproteobacteria bacterium RIFOXYA12_FULL_58_15]|nr:MAG: hypothetical protein A2289_01580 [Deltaproteobacteria bacterium RIFOXYA12_FULL_58_15]
MTLDLAGIFGAGLLTYMTPCVLPLMPMYLAALAGGELAQIGKLGRGRLLIRAALFSVGFIAVFTLMGLGASSIGALLVSQKLVIGIFGGVLVLLFGLKFLHVIEVPWFDRVLKGSDAKWNGASAWGALVMGVIFAAGWSPCVGPILGSVLTYTAANASDSVMGAGYLAVYGAGFALPLVVTAAFAEAGIKVLRRAQSWLPRIERMLGVAMVAVAITMLLPATVPVPSDPKPPVATKSQMLELFSEDCVVCQQMAPVVDRLRNECSGRGVAIEQIDVSLPQNRHLVGQHRLVGVPTFLFFDGENNEIARLVGKQSDESLRQTLSALVGESCEGVGRLPNERAPTEQVPCVGNGTEEEGACHSTNTNATPVESSSMRCAISASEKSSLNVPNVASRVVVCSPALL